MKELTLDQVEQIAHGLAKRIMEWNEPIPEFGSRFPGILESCLQTPLQTFAQRDLYPTLQDKAAILFYLLIKNHPFQNGNKRIAVTSLLTFLILNKKWLNIPPDDLYKLALWTAESLPTAKDGTVQAVKDTIIRYLTEWEAGPFRNGMILQAEHINEMCKSINSLEQLMNLQKTSFRTLKKGGVLRAQDLNDMMDAINKINFKRTGTNKNWKWLPVKSGEALKAETVNEIWGKIGASVAAFQEELVPKT